MGRKPGPKTSFTKNAVAIGTMIDRVLFSRIEQAAVHRRRSKSFILREIIENYFTSLDSEKH